MRTATLIGAITLGIAWALIPAGTGRATTPTGTQLLSQMEAAMQQAGSAHARIHSGADLANSRSTMRQTATGYLEISTRQQQMHMLFVDKTTTLTGRPITVTTRTEVIAVDNRLAQRSDREMWACTPLDSQDRPAYYAYTFYLPSQPLKVETTGSGTLRGTAIWFVTVTPDPRHTNQGPIVLAIRQSDYRLVRESLTMGIKGTNPGQFRVILDYSRYGAPLNVQLPASCG